jgi:hypothetical protein
MTAPDICLPQNYLQVLKVASRGLKLLIILLHCTFLLFPAADQPFYCQGQFKVGSVHYMFGAFREPFTQFAHHTFSHERLTICVVIFFLNNTHFAGTKY